MSLGSTGYIAAKPVYFNDLVYASNGLVFVSDPYGNTSTATQASTFFSSTNPISMCFLNLAVYMTDGSTLAQLNTSTQTMSLTTASTGTLPTFVSDCVNWRGRLIYYGDANNPQNIYASRIGNPEDFNYAATDEASAWAANLSQAGQIGTPVTVVIPFNDDLCLVSCINQLWLFSGDLSAGGSIVFLSDHLGVLGPYAWCTDPQDLLYFVGTAGLFSLRPVWAEYSPPQLLTGQNWAEFFTQIDRNANYVNLEYDELNKYVHILVQPTAGGAGQHLVYDTRNGGLWPIQYNSTIGPNRAATYTPGSPGVKQIFAMGGLDGNIYQVDPTVVDDNGTAISSFITFAPVNPNPDGESILNRVQIDMGEMLPPYTNINSYVSTNNQIFDGAGNTFGNAPDTLIGTVDSTNVTFSTSFPIYGGTGGILGAYFTRSTGFGDILDASVTVQGTNQITIGHPILSTFMYGPGEVQTVGYYLSYYAASTININGFNASITVLGGPTAADVSDDGFSSPSGQFWTAPVTFDRRQPAMLGRLGYPWFGLTISNSTDAASWVFERAEMTFVPGGRNRRYR